MLYIIYIYSFIYSWYYRTIYIYIVGIPRYNWYSNIYWYYSNIYILYILLPLLHTQSDRLTWHTISFACWLRADITDAAFSGGVFASWSQSEIVLYGSTAFFLDVRGTIQASSFIAYYPQRFTISNHIQFLLFLPVLASPSAHGFVVCPLFQT